MIKNSDAGGGRCDLRKFAERGIVMCIAGEPTVC
jgi:hypothetical protein